MLFVVDGDFRMFLMIDFNSMYIKHWDPNDDNVMFSDTVVSSS